MTTKVNFFCAVLVILGSLLTLPADAQERSTFVLGLGVSPGLLSFDPVGSPETDPSLAAGLKIGSTLSKGFQLYFSTLISPIGRKYLHTEVYALGGLTLRYFIEDQSPSAFVVAGGDIGIWDRPGWFEFGAGPGVRVGAGYAISEHWNGEGTFSWVSGEEFKISSLWISLSYEI